MPLPAIIGAGLAAIGRGAAAIASRAGAYLGRIFSKTPGALVGAASRRLTKARRHGGRAASDHSPAQGESRWGRAANFLWASDMAENMAARFWSKSEEGWFPAFHHTIAVAVAGGPESDLRRIWFLAVAAAFGRYRNRVRGIQGVQLQATWDITGKAVAITIGYSNNGLPDALSRGANFATGQLGGLDLIRQGPDQVTIGANWASWTNTIADTLQSSVGTVLPFLGGGLAVGVTVAQKLHQWITTTARQNKLSTIPGKPPSPFPAFTVSCNVAADRPRIIFGKLGGRKINVVREIPEKSEGTFSLPWKRVTPDPNQDYQHLQIATGIIPQLPDAGRIITTGERYDTRVQNPRPQVDGISRSSLVSLVSQAISNPCYLPASPPCDIIPRTSGGGIYVPGATESSEKFNETFNVVTDKVRADLAAPPGINTVIPFFPNTELGIDGYPGPKDVPSVRN